MIYLALVSLLLPYNLSPGHHDGEFRYKKEVPIGIRIIN